MQLQTRLEDNTLLRQALLVLVAVGLGAAGGLAIVMGNPIVPFVALVGGLAAVVILVRAWKMRPAPPPVDGVRAVSGAQLEHFRKQAQKETEI